MNDVPWGPLVAAIVVGYAFGSLSPAAAAAKLLGKDLRAVGSGNPGATNAARAMGPAVGVLVGVLDVLKGFLPAWYFARYGQPCAEFAGLAAVLGHVTSPLLKGKGGKGVATSLGAVLAIHPVWALPVLAVFGITVAMTKRMGIGSVVATLALVPASFLLWNGWAGVIFTVGLSAIVVVRHIPNIVAFVRSVGRGSSSGPESGAGGTATSSG